MNPITAHEAQEMRHILEPVFGTQVHSWVIKLATYEALGKLIVENNQGARARHLVPQPHDFSTPFKWDQKQVRQALVRYFGTDDGKLSLVGMRSAGLKMKRAFEEARYAGY
jgi:uncharacterized membrane-anchored protein